MQLKQDKGTAVHVTPLGKWFVFEVEFNPNVQNFTLLSYILTTEANVSLKFKPVSGNPTGIVALDKFPSYA